jgi:hypothetical protein
MKSQTYRAPRGSDKYGSSLTQSVVDYPISTDVNKEHLIPKA